jgi:hypothetical protein
MTNTFGNLAPLVTLEAQNALNQRLVGHVVSEQVILFGAQAR